MGKGLHLGEYDVVVVCLGQGGKAGISGTTGGASAHGCFIPRSLVDYNLAYLFKYECLTDIFRHI